MTGRPAPARPSGDPLAIVVAGGSRLARSSIRATIHDCFEDTATVSDADDAAQLLSECQERPHVVVSDIDVAGTSLLTLLPQLLLAEARVVVISSQESAPLLPELLLRGATGFLPLESTGPRELWAAVRNAASGGATLHPGVAMLVLEQWRAMREGNAPSLTAKESEILRAMIAGRQTKAIARDLGLSIKTIETHRSKIYTKLGVRTGPQAVQKALELGLS